MTINPGFFFNTFTFNLLQNCNYQGVQKIKQKGSSLAKKSYHITVEILFWTAVILDSDDGII
jgi:hypothetical protein